MVVQHYRWDFIGLSTDEKPTPATSEKVVDGSTFYCSDNSKLYVFCKDTWYEKTATGGGGTTYTAGDGIDITEGEISVDPTYVATLEELDARINKGAGAPTTATEGVVGGLYEDTTNGKLYICTEVTAGVDPDPDTYTWGEVGAGGGGVTPVQTTGTSTTDVMSQDATTKMIYPDIANSSKINIGESSTNVGGGVSIHGSIHNNASGIAIGTSKTNRAQIGILGRSFESIALIGSVGKGDYDISIGSDAFATYSGGYNGNNVAIGHNAIASDGGVANYSVALGAEAKTTRSGEINVGAGSTTNGYNGTSYRVIGGVHDGQLAHDAVTVSQVNATIDAINNALSTSIPHIGA